MQARFFVFAGSDYSERGGWRHYQRRFLDRDLALSYAIGLLGGDTDWVQIVDVLTNKMTEKTAYEEET